MAKSYPMGYSSSWSSTSYVVILGPTVEVLGPNYSNECQKYVDNA